MTAHEFKGYADTVMKAVLVIFAGSFFWRALELARTLPNDTLFVSLASGGAMTALLALYNYFFGSSNKTPLPPDTLTITETKTPEEKK